MYQENPEDIIEQASIELTKYEALLRLLSDNRLAAHIECCGMSLGVVDITRLIPAVKHTIGELRKAIKRQPNEWE
jgi:transcription initiation factor IIE alpha subunit